MEDNGARCYCLNDWKSITQCKMILFLALVISGIVVKLQQRLYRCHRLCRTHQSLDNLWPTYVWNKYKSVFIWMTLAFRLTQTLKLLASFIKPLNADMFDTVRPLVNRTEWKCASVNYCVKHLAVNESNMPWQDRLQFIRYIPSKVLKYGTKMHCLCDCRKWICLQTENLYRGGRQSIGEGPCGCVTLSSNRKGIPYDLM